MTTCGGHPLTACLPVSLERIKAMSAHKISQVARLRHARKARVFGGVERSGLPVLCAVPSQQAHGCAPHNFIVQGWSPAPACFSAFPLVGLISYCANPSPGAWRAFHWCQGAQPPGAKACARVSVYFYFFLERLPWPFLGGPFPLRLQWRPHTAYSERDARYNAAHK